MNTIEHIDLERLYQTQIAEEQKEKQGLYNRVKELADEVYVLKAKMQGLEFQISEYQQIVKELSERLTKQNG